MTKRVREGILVIWTFGIVLSFVIRASSFFSTPRKALGLIFLVGSGYGNAQSGKSCITND